MFMFLFKLIKFFIHVKTINWKSLKFNKPSYIFGRRTGNAFWKHPTSESPICKYSNIRDEITANVEPNT